MPSANPVQKQLALDLPVLTPGLPDFGEIGLNRALPLAQSQHWMPTSQKLHVERLKETKQVNQSFNCGRQGNESCDDKGWVGFTRYIRDRCDQRRWDSCTVFREKNRRDKTTDEVDAGTPALQREWLAAGNTDVCQECGKGREGGGREGNFMGSGRTQGVELVMQWRATVTK
ncbi:hypothetical protein FOCG_01213 [Fusarium oxysporum f. sp. radicis-lycopersici 26381]|uniref:Uncharacterized protein n=1 Tax=Fusarium oxysporum Fo47 TaxID=660027 RepID=W9KW78_FUSOX|nr:hypothetical protein FOZG_05708 [Fusarium oxysporum Fo47]EXL62708.1 hypothetical protein FOCG_01213 [Fusarium oxysporum f. sp. radicis-lycopersici 26381]